MSTYVPRCGDIIWLNFDPSLGHEQKGRRPALVVSSMHMNAVGLAYVVPITSKQKGYPTEVQIKGEMVHGLALVSSLRSIDWGIRKITYAEKCPTSQLRKVLGMIVSIIEDEE